MDILGSGLIYILTGLIGFGVGIGELVGRYRDAPEDALGQPAAWVYIGLNAAAAAVALALVRELGVFADAKNGALWEVMVAGFGSMAFFRSALFNVRIGDTEVGVGPAIFLQVLMNATDRATDRARAAPRSKAVKEIMHGVDFDKASAALPALCLALMQNVSTSEVRALGTTVAELGRASMGPSSKVLALGLALMNLVGERVLREAVATLGGQIRRPALATIEIISRLADISFTRHAKTLVEACLTLSRAGTNDHRAMLQRQYETFANLPALEDSDRVLLLVTDLLDSFGPEVVEAALSFVGSPRPMQPPIATAVPQATNVVVLDTGRAPDPQAPPDGSAVGDAAEDAAKPGAEGAKKAAGKEPGGSADA